jgi:hypothetical protein
MKLSKEEQRSLFLDIDNLLFPKPLRLETGIQRLSNGMLQVSMRTDLHGCKSKMLDWWFTYFETTEHLKWWHPHDHILHSGWDSKWVRNENYIGATIHATEALGEIPPVPATIKFHAPEEVFNPILLQKAYEEGNVGAVIYARIGFGKDTVLDNNGDPEDGFMFHVARDTPFGCTLRSHFYLGALTADTETPLHENIGFGLMEHCYTEFTYLSHFLSSLYYAENKNGDKAPLPW